MNRKRINKGKLVLGILIILAIIVAILLVIKFIPGTKAKVIKKEESYIASNTNKVITYILNEEDILIEDKELIRGTKVIKYDIQINKEEKNYNKIELDNNIYYIEPEYLVSNIKDTVLEKKKFVRTSSTIYENELDSDILSLVKKGNEVEVTGFDKLDDKGNVNMYKINYNDINGWVYSKYLVDTMEEAKANYNENGTYDIHKDRKYSGRELYGGKASTLDYYPYERIEFEGNPLLKEAKTLYLNAGTINGVDSYIRLAKDSGINAIVVDIKDGALAYSSNVAKEMSPTAYRTAINDNEKYRTAIKKIKDAGLYAIGRIVVFNDVHYGKDHPDECIKSGYSSNWPSAYSRGAWEYNVKLAKEAVTEMGFNEIQFDYVRFPEASYKMSISSNTDFKNKYNEEKAEAIQNFLFYASDEIHKVNAYLSVDVFGECSSEYVTAYGQYWPAISNIVDVISSMPYTDHFGRNNNTWSNPYRTINNWAKGAAKRQTEIPTPAVARTWITAYDTPYWNVQVIYDANKISDQIRGLYDAGLKGGFITWNSASNINKYRQIQSAFGKDYNN